MNLEQLKKKRDSCMEIINKATAEKEEIDEQIDRIVIVHTKKALSKCKLSVTELMKLGEITPDKLKALFDQIGKEIKVNKDVSREKENHEKSM